MSTNKILRIAVVALLCSSLPVYAIRPVYTEQQKQAAKMKEALQKLGSGYVRVAVVTRDGRTVAGRLGIMNNGGLGIINLQDGSITDVNIANVTGIHANNLSTGESVGIGVGITAGVLLLLYCGLSERGFCRN